MSERRTHAEPSNHGAFTHLEGELAWTVADHRSATDAIAMTRHLVDADEGRHELLGLAAGCEAAVFWDHLRHGVATVPFDATGLDAFGPVDVAGPRRKGEYLASAAVEGWAWVHPRHRWRRE